MALIVFVVLLVLLVPSRAQPPADPSRFALVLDIQGAIGPAVSEYLRQASEVAAERKAALIVLRMDTPGGLASSMHDIIRDILASPVPVITYVAPSGARAASAGTYILYASSLAAMAPGTNVGAATPVQLGGGSPFGDSPDKEGKEGEKGAPSPTDTSMKKAVNDAVAYIRSLAELHGRNADWAEQAVRDAASLSASAALEQRVIEIVATDLPDLLAQADGRSVRLGNRTVTLSTKGLDTVSMQPDWRVRLLAVISDPNIAYILLLIGIYGIIFEFFSPGMVAPGVIGAIALTVALFALNLLPLNYAGVGLLLIGVALIVAEAFAPSFGSLGIGGVIAFALGSLFMFEKVPGFELSLPVVLTASAASATLFAIILAVAIRAHRQKVVSGEAVMIGSVGEVLSWSDTEGEIHVHSENWRARSAGSLKPGQRVRVISRDGLTLTVEPEG
ncbi:NfeD family protein [Flaviflagellibacter deserti]|uniref:Nodulation protein NfeD n=1 Tax=Flaviflagellibacter deserti TaxID=2267266 RepID=A0ABV9YUE6_9HYPH